MEVAQCIGVETELVEDRGVEAIHVVAPDLRNGLVAKFVGATHGGSRLDATAGHPHREPRGVVIPAGTLGIFGDRLASEFAAPDHQRVVEHAALLQVLEKACNRLVGVAAVVLVVLHEIAMGVPVRVIMCASRIDLDESDATLDESARQQALATEVVRTSFADPVELLGLRVLVLEIDGLRCGRLHSIGQFVAVDSGLEIRVSGPKVGVSLVVVLQAIEDLSLQRT